MKYLIIGISGASCSGKTSIAEKVHERFKDSILIKQDDFFLSIDDPRHVNIPELNHFNWEIISSLDMPKMLSNILEIINSTTDIQEIDDKKEVKLLIIEGFTIYNYKPVADLCNLMYFINISKEVCWNRRKVRVYNPPDVPGYFEKVVWPEYLRHNSEIMSDKNTYDIKILDGNKSLNELSDEIINDINKSLF